MTDIKHSHDKERSEINWKNEPYSSQQVQHSMNMYAQQAVNNSDNEPLAKMVGISSTIANGSENLEKEESDSLSGYSDDENHKRKQRRYR